MSVKMTTTTINNAAVTAIVCELKENPNCLVCMESMVLNQMPFHLVAATAAAGAAGASDSDSLESDSECNTTTATTTNTTPMLSISTLQTCRHIFHSKCIHAWAMHANTCPSCRARFEQTQEWSISNSCNSYNQDLSSMSMPLVAPGSDSGLATVTAAATPSIQAQGCTPIEYAEQEYEIDHEAQEIAAEELQLEYLLISPGDGRGSGNERSLTATATSRTSRGRRGTARSAHIAHKLRSAARGHIRRWRMRSSTLGASSLSAARTSSLRRTSRQNMIQHDIVIDHAGSIVTVRQHSSCE
jgi:Ring finger domain